MSNRNDAQSRKDKRFVMYILNEIIKYANENDLEVDDTIDAVAEWIIGLRELCTFNGCKGDWKCQE